ncbi:sensor histidine kinase N-terminal domain-containing protein [Luteolibacter yonseiensis]|uniref:histidine kinase n=1 Tax=Luteolibacter yonseiensis TaxID=1144680 RepID=A0A934V7R7_9BACT|nr:ATP-binding protein [Luteolibacter yonseiensis]MBK1816442.1 sensor histidine kinase N-terminal domain-containing protein [Luteolibacter yonseiensis]
MKSLRVQLTVALGISMCLLLLAGGLGTFFVTKEVLEDQFDDTLVAKATALITATEIDDEEFEIDLTVQDFAGFGSGGEDYFEIRRGDGSVMVLSPSLALPGRTLMPEFPVPQDGGARMVSDHLTDGRPARFYVQRFVPKDDDKREYQDLWLIVAGPTQGLLDDLWVLGSVIAGVSALVLVLTVPLLWMVLARGLRPLESLGRQVREIPVTRLERRLDLAGQPEELVPLGESLNEWLGRMESSFERERRFSSHAAHELRTPLAELRMMAELGATWPDQATPERCGEIVKVADELEALLEKLSLLARTDAGSQAVELVEVDIQVGVEAVLERLSGAATAKNLTIRPRTRPGVFRTDVVLWTTVLQNLLGNAVSHAPAGSVISLDASPDMLRISNPAPDLNGRDLDKLFERFWRKNPSHQEEAHSGLGLSIVRACVGLLGGKVKARLDEGGIFLVEVEWSGN